MTLSNALPRITVDPWSAGAKADGAVISREKAAWGPRPADGRKAANLVTCPRNRGTVPLHLRWSARKATREAVKR